ncbi:MAG: hypothetical protein V4439_03045 [Patescibacteria group bacterium]
MKKINFASLLVCISLIIIALAVGYYFVSYLPKKDREVSLSQNIVKCQELGIKKYASESEKNNTKSFESMFIASKPQYRYDEGLKACLYLGGFSTLEINSYFVVDLYTNKEIISYTEDTKKIDVAKRAELFDSKVKELGFQIISN